MNITALVTEFMGTRAPGWLVLDAPEVLECAVSAARFYAGYGDIQSISQSNTLPGAPDPSGGPGAPVIADPGIGESLPIKSLGYITVSTVLSTGEWAVIRPLFVLYTERENAMRLEASRALGLEVYGRSVSEIASDIAQMESPDGLPSKAFSHVIIEVS